METEQQALPRLATAGNALTISRLLILPVILAGIALDEGYLAAGAMCAALITDLLDGRISRRLGQASEFGRSLDSSVDFVLLHGVFIALYAAGHMLTYQFAVIYVAMLATLTLQFATTAADPEQGVIRSRFGKPTGALEYLYLLLLLAFMAFPGVKPLGVAAFAVFWALAASVVLYVGECVFQLRKLA